MIVILPRLTLCPVDGDTNGQLQQRNIDIREPLQTTNTTTKLWLQKLLRTCSRYHEATVWRAEVIT